MGKGKDSKKAVKKEATKSVKENGNNFSLNPNSAKKNTRTCLQFWGRKNKFLEFNFLFIHKP